MYRVGTFRFLVFVISFPTNRCVEHNYYLSICIERESRCIPNRFFILGSLFSSWSKQKMRFTEVFRSIDWKGFGPALVVVLNTFIWYTLTYNTFSNTINASSIQASWKLALFSMYILGTAGSAVVGALYLKCRRETCLLLWMLMGAIMTAMLTTISDNNMVLNASISFFLGVSLGIGFPSCLAYFAEATTVETRGTCGGVTWGLVGIVIGIGTVIGAVSAVSLNVSSTFLTLACWRAFGFISLYLIIKLGRFQQSLGSYTYTSVFRRREVLLYLIPWIMVSLVNFMEAPIVQNLFGNLADFMGLVEFSLIGLFALLGGILADLVGRKRVIISGFIMLGIGYAVLSFSSDVSLFQYIYTFCDGIAWGMFSSVFLITLWGDLAQDRKKEIYYLIGGLPFLLSAFLSILVQPYIGSVNATESFSLASFFLFSAVLPLIYAPETLPEKRVIEIELKDYLEKAQKVRDKYS